MIDKAVKLCRKALEHDKKLLFIGNGGSCSQAEHLACEFGASGFMAFALTNSSTLTAIANDYEFKEVFSAQVDAVAREGDILFALSTSGMSENINNAVLAAHDKNCKVIALTGRHTPLAKIADISIEFDGNTQTIQEETLKAGHDIWCKVIDAGMVG